MVEEKQQQEQRTIDQVPMLHGAETTESSTTKKRRRRRRKKSNPSSTSPNLNSPDSHQNCLRRCRRARKNQIHEDSSYHYHHPPLSKEEQSKYVALDCEMVGAGPQGYKSILARVCLINWDNDVIFDTYVIPTEVVTDYRTFVSGITPQHLNSSSSKAIDIDTCRAVVASHLEGKILVGHALKNDLQVLNLHHPWYDIRDTGKYEPFMTTMTTPPPTTKMPIHGSNRLWPRKLKELAKEKLGGRIIQDLSKGAHDPVEDAKAALDLYKLVRTKWEKVMDYKIQKTNEIIMTTTTTSQQQQQQQHDKHLLKINSFVSSSSGIEQHDVIAVPQ